MNKTNTKSSVLLKHHLKALKLPTPQKALDSAQPGDMVYIHKGLYRGRLNFPRSGTASARITLQGEEGAILDGSPLIKDWELDPKMGEQGVYRRSTQDLEFTPFTMTWNNKYIMRLSSTQENSKTPEKYFARFTAPPSDTSWATLGALFGSRDDYVYVRFGDKQNQNHENINFGMNPYKEGGGTVNISGVNYITIRGFTIQCGGAGVIIRRGGNDNVIE